ncbi:L-aspartate oxidase [Shouchella miscanthi]|uniref:L-aspartate oxidase n=1 Tax=Shouchella miscanthi TaxID=2598861 RepID=UPI0016438749|nr:L-aspartate oxidase [Shouchella miscanthi]
MKTVIIIGSGIASLTAAHKLADHFNVIIFTKSSYKESNSAFAQGGIAAALDKMDHPIHHFQDTLSAGKGANDVRMVKLITEKAGNLIHELEEIGVQFDTQNGYYALGREGAHQKNRIVHVKDQTGKAIIETLWARVAPRVTVYEHTEVTGLIRKGGVVTGICTLEREWTAYAVVLATGGVGQLYALNSNARTATGEGMYLAYQAGAVLKDLEYIQFHPTILKGKYSILISEAVRGEGGYLINGKQERLMSRYPKGDLEGRDLVSAVLHEAIVQGEDIYLDVRHLHYFSTRFPFLYQACLQKGIDPARTPIPVAPGAHFICGGVEVDQVGRTAVGHLYAIGEVACSGVHGANRLASNSLLEAIYFATACADDIVSESKKNPPVHPDDPFSHVLVDPQEHLLPKRDELQQRMMHQVGIKRSQQGLQEMLEWLDAYRRQPASCKQSFEDKGMFEVATFITRAALTREESRGTHQRSDFLTESSSWRERTIRFCYGKMSVITQGGFCEQH